MYLRQNIWEEVCSRAVWILHQTELPGLKQKRHKFFDNKEKKLAKEEKNNE